MGTSSGAQDFSLGPLASNSDGVYGVCEKILTGLVSHQVETELLVVRWKLYLGQILSAGWDQLGKVKNSRMGLATFTQDEAQVPIILDGELSGNVQLDFYFQQEEGQWKLSDIQGDWSPGPPPGALPAPFEPEDTSRHLP